MPSSLINVSLPFEVYVDVMRAADERQVSLSKMVAFYTIQGYGLESRGFYVVPQPLLNKAMFIAPKKGQKLLPTTILNPEGQRYQPEISEAVEC